jgi:hypothetical protein
MAGFEVTLYGRIWVTPEVFAAMLVQAKEEKGARVTAT